MKYNLHTTVSNLILFEEFSNFLMKLFVFISQAMNLESVVIF